MRSGAYCAAIMGPISSGEKALSLTQFIHSVWRIMPGMEMGGGGTKRRIFGRKDYIIYCGRSISDGILWFGWKGEKFATKNAF